MAILKVVKAWWAL